MRFFDFTVIAVFLMAGLAFSGLSFIQQPSLTKSGGHYNIQFELSDYTDVEVSIVRVSDSTVARHLAAGLLGANPPSPLTPNSKSQSLTWDGKDDLGAAVTDADSCKVRVRAGMDFKLWNIVGDNPYAFGKKVCGLALDPSGNVFIFGVHGSLDATTIRSYDASGNYLRTLFPIPAGMTPSEITGWGVNTWPDNSYNPKTVFVPSPTITPTLAGDLSNTLLPGVANNELYVVSIPGLDFIKVGADSRFGGTGLSAKLVTSPAAPYWRNIGGPVFLSLSPDSAYFLLSGYYEYNSATGASDTGFWRDGRVFKINRTTGAASVFLSLDSVPKAWAARQSTIGPQYGTGSVMAAVHGTAFDRSGRIYICDRLHREIGVYDTTGARVGGLPVDDPDLVEVNRTTGELYVTTRRLTGYHVGVINIRKYSGFAPGASLTAKLDSFVTQVGEVFSSPYAEKTNMVVSQSGAAPLLWLSSFSSTLGKAEQNSIWAVRDDGDRFTVVKDFYQLYKGTLKGFDRIAVDRKKENVYVNDSWYGLFKIENWKSGSPVLSACSTSARKPLYGTEVAFSHDGLMYVREGTGYSGPITRYTGDHLHVPAPFANTGTHIMTPYIYSRYGAGYGEHGFGIAPDKRLAIMYMHAFAQYFVGALGDSAQRVTGDNTGAVDTLVKPIAGGYLGCGGVRFDMKGNLYVGASIRNPAHQIPAGFTADWGYTRTVGAVIRYPAGARGSVDVASKTAPGSEKVYTVAFAPFSGTSGECQCRSPRFDLDPYGRLYAPNAITSKVTVVDNNDNPIGVFGAYGNRDSRGPGSLIPTPAIPLAWPLGAAASEDYIYVSDIINQRIVQVRMDYALDNIRGLTDRGGLTAETAAPPTFALSARPNPAHGRSLVRCALPRASFVTLAVYDMRGRLVRTLVSGHRPAGVHSVAWNGRDQSGRSVAGGLYAFRLTAGNRTLVFRTLLTR